METVELIEMIREGARGADPGDTMIFPETGKIICVAELLEVADRLESLDKRWKRTVVERDQAREMRARAERLLAEKTSGDLIDREALLEEFRWLASEASIARAAEYDEIIARIEAAEAVEKGGQMYKRIYDSDEIMVDLDGRKLRISTFEDGHWVDEHFVELPEPELPEVLTLEETAQYLRVSNQTAYNMLREGRIRGTKVGREWRFLRSDIVAYLCGTGMEPLGHAHWVTAYEFDFGIGEKRKTGYNCSRCGLYYTKKRDRCPDCGAHMDEEVSCE